MKIQRLELKNFGKFSDKQIDVRDGIHIIYGENESGKTTLHTFIQGMLFGMERGRGRASIHDTFKKYEPWDNANYYAGVMIFESGNKTFRLERNFDRYSKKAILICEDDGEELSVTDGDLEMILSGLQRKGYEDTLCIGQLHAKTSQALALELKTYAANYYTAGDSEINLSKAQALLLARQKEADKQIKAIMQQKQEKRGSIEQEASYVWREIHRIEEAIEEVGAKIANREKKELENSRRNREAKSVIDEIRPPKWRIHPLEIIAMLIFVIGAFALVDRPWNYLVAIIIALLGGIYVWNRMKDGKYHVKSEPERILEEIMPEEGQVPDEKLFWEQEHLKEELSEKKIEYENLKERLEELYEGGSECKEQERKRAALSLAENRLEQLSSDMQGRLRADLNQEASHVIEAITAGRYERLLIDEELHMSLVTEGRLVAMEQVSQGTLEQVYFALRIAVSRLLHEEEYPIILDDTFVFYDEKRLERTLKWLAACKRQVLLFTCQKREEEILLNNGIAFTKIQL